MMNRIFNNIKKSKFRLSQNNLYKKELIYCGDFVDGEQEFSIDESLLEHWVETFYEMKGDGIKVPVPLGHSFNAEDERGVVEDLEIKEKSLIATIRFYDNADVETLINSDVSVEVPSEIKAGNGKIYKEPIRHIALTSYPVIPNMSGFLKLSLINKNGENNMKNKKLSSIRKSLSLDETATIAEIVAEIEKLEDEVEEVKEEKSLENEDVEKEETKEELKEEIKKELIEEIKNETLDLENEDKKDEEDEEKKELKLSLLKLSNQNRKLEIENLVKDGYISVATKNHLVKSYCNENIKLSLSQIDSNFNNIVDILKMQGKLRYGEKTGGQVLECSLSGKDNPLIRDAENRNKKNK